MTVAEYTPDPADVSRYGALLHEAAHGPGREFCRPVVCRQFDRYAEVLLSALAADGRLPAGTEWTVQTPGGITLPPGYTEQTARRRAAEIGGTAVMRRVGSWQPVPTQSAEEKPDA